MRSLFALAMPVLLLAAASVFIPASDDAPAATLAVMESNDSNANDAAEAESTVAPKCTETVQVRCAYCSYYWNPGTGFDYRFCDEGRAGFSEKFCNAWALNRCPAI